MINDPDFGFVFEPPPGWTAKQLPCLSADSLAEALAVEPSFSSFVLSEVWCLRSCNLIWASTGFYHIGPWEDPPLATEPKRP